MTSPSVHLHDADLALWSDEPSQVDLLAFDAVAQTVVDAILDDALDPLAIGVSGRWGSGKTTVLQLIEQQLNTPGGPEPTEKRVLILRTDPWRYDPAVGAKESLISEVLDVLGQELKGAEGTGGKALNLLKNLAKRVDWAKAVKVAARTSLTLQLPSVDDLTSLIREDGGDQESTARGLDEFREEFAELMASEELKDIKRLVVLVDDLDRCLPDTVVETLETIRLFLAVPKMAFVLAADEDRVADAVRSRFPDGQAAAAGEEEEPARLYLHKIVQTTIPLPTLSRFDTEAYLLLLQLQSGQDALDEEKFKDVVGQCARIRMESGDLDDLNVPEGTEIGSAVIFAARLTPLLYEKLRGNPRRIKRFLNDMRVRQSIAARRGIELETPIVAKLMVLELLLPEDFKRVLEWLAQGRLREQIQRLEKTAGRTTASQDSPTPADGKREESPKADSGKASKSGEKEMADSSPDQERDGFSDNLVRWAKLPPELSQTDLNPYLTLAASFRGEALLDRDLPERLIDLAANLLSSVRAEQKSVTDDDLRALTAEDASILVGHLGRAARDRPSEQRAAMTGLLRITRLHPSTVEAAEGVLRAIPADEIKPAVALGFTPADVATFRPILEGWHETSTDGGPTKTALSSVLGGGGTT
jgi:hypothetical protein